MVNYAVTDVEIGPNTLTNVLAAMETAIEAVDNTKTLRLVQIYHVYGDTFKGALIHDA